MKVPSRFFMRLRIAGCSVMAFQPNMVFCTIMNTARPQANDMMMNMAGSSALPYAWRATRKAKMEPVPVVSRMRQMKVARPATFEYGFMRCSIRVHR